MHKISDAVRMRTRVTVCVCTCAWGGGHLCLYYGVSLFSSPLDQQLSWDGLASKGCLYHKAAMLTDTRKGTHSMWK